MGFFISMRYHKLTEKQLHEMHEEFSIFLSSQGIDKVAWDRIKTDKPEEINKFITSFSEIVWEKILTDCEFIEFLTPDQIFLFNAKKNFAHLIVVKLQSKTIDLTTSKGFELMLKKINEDSVELFEASKPYIPSRNLFIYNQLKKGAILSKGKRYKRLKSYFQNSPK